MALIVHIFLHREKGKKHGLYIDDIRSPYEIWKKKLPEGVAYVFDVDSENGTLFKKLNKNPAYTTKKIQCNN